MSSKDTPTFFSDKETRTQFRGNMRPTQILWECGAIPVWRERLKNISLLLQLPDNVNNSGFCIIILFAKSKHAIWYCYTNIKSSIDCPAVWDHFLHVTFQLNILFFPLTFRFFHFCFSSQNPNSQQSGSIIDYSLEIIYINSFNYWNN